MDVADNADRGPAVLLPPKHHREGVEVGLQLPARFVDAGKTVHGKAVQHHRTVQGSIDLAFGNNHILHESKEVHKPQPN